MNDLNTTLLEGRLVRDPELSYTSKGLACCNFSIANNRYYKQDDEFKQEVSYFDVVVWGKRAETCAEYLKKGRGVRVCGRIRQDRWQDEAGNTYRKVRIIADYVEFKPESRGKNDLAAPDNEADAGDMDALSNFENQTNLELEPEEALQLTNSPT